MHYQDVVQYQKERLQNPWVRIPMFILGCAVLLGMLPLIAASPARTNPGTWMVLALAATTLPLLVLWLSPAPWLWTGGRASHAPLLRGVLQSALFNGAILSLILALYMAIIFLTDLEDSWARAAGGVFSNLMIWGPAAMLAGYSITVWERTNYAKEETERRLREAQWVLLRGQLSPHVLFNALNGLAELVHVDPSRRRAGPAGSLGPLPGPAGPWQPARGAPGGRARPGDPLPGGRVHAARAAPAGDLGVGCAVRHPAPASVPGPALGGERPQAWNRPASRKAAS